MIRRGRGFLRQKVIFSKKWLCSKGVDHSGDFVVLQGFRAILLIRVDGSGGWSSHLCSPGKQLLWWIAHLVA